MAKKDYDKNVVVEHVTKEEKAGGAYADASREALIELLEKRDVLNKSLEAELSKTENRLAECSAEYGKLQEKAFNTEKALSEAEDKIEELKGAREEAERRVAEMSKTLAKYEAEKSELLEQIEDKEYASKTAQLYLERSYKAKIDDLNDRIADLTTELKDAKGKTKKLEADLKKANKKAGDSEVIVDEMSARYLEDNLREELMEEDERAINAQIDECVDSVLDMFTDLKVNIKTERAARFAAKKQVMLDEAADREEKERKAEEIKRLKESLATLQHVIEAKEEANEA